jgi:hypothetical protein
MCFSSSAGDILSSLLNEINTSDTNNPSASTQMDVEYV